MAVQVLFDIPSRIQEGLDNGTLIRYGGIIRDEAGHIVKHLNEVPISNVAENSNKILEYAKNKKSLFIGAAVLAAVAAGVTYIVSSIKNGKADIPKCVSDFDESFKKYIDSIKKGTVTEEKIDDVILALDKIKKNKENNNVTLTLSFENANLLLDIIKKYTIKFAEANSFELPAIDFDDRNEIVNLEHYLKIQKQVFNACA